MNLLDRTAALLPGDDPVLGRLYTTLGTALIEAGQFEKAEAALYHAQRITAANGDERQHAHARVEALLLHLKMNPNEAEIEIARALPELRREFDASQDDRGICRTLQLEAALHWNHARSGAAEYAWRRAADYARKVNDRRQLADIARLARLGRALGTDTRTGRDKTMQGLPRRDRKPPHRKGRDPPEHGRPLCDAGRLRGGTGNAQHREISAGNPRPHDDGGNYPARRPHCDARRRSSDRREISSARIRLPLPDGRAALPGHHRGDIWPEPSRRKARAGTTRPSG